MSERAEDRTKKRWWIWLDLSNSSWHRRRRTHLVIQKLSLRVHSRIPLAWKTGCIVVYARLCVRERSRLFVCHFRTSGLKNHHVIISISDLHIVRMSTPRCTSTYAPPMDQVPLRRLVLYGNVMQRCCFGYCDSTMSHERECARRGRWVWDQRLGNETRAYRSGCGWCSEKESCHDEQNCIHCCLFPPHSYPQLSASRNNACHFHETARSTSSACKAHNLNKKYSDKYHNIVGYYGTIVW